VDNCQYTRALNDVCRYPVAAHVDGSVYVPCVEKEHEEDNFDTFDCDFGDDEPSLPRATRHAGCEGPGRVSIPCAYPVYGVRYSLLLGVTVFWGAGGQGYRSHS